MIEDCSSTTESAKWCKNGKNIPTYIASLMVVAERGGAAMVVTVVVRVIAALQISSSNEKLLPLLST